MSAPGTNKVDVEYQNDVAIVTIDHFPLNTLSNAVQLGIETAAEDINKKKNVKAVVVKGAGKRAFCAGADVVDLNKKHEKYPKKAFTKYFEPLNVPVVAAMQGFTLGGGLELALSCHYRVIESRGALGLPEVNIGLLPGGEGTQRLPRLMGSKAALDLMLSGAHIPAKAAHKVGVVDHVCEHKNLLQDAIQFALKVAKENPTLSGRRISQLPPPIADVDFTKVRKQMSAKRKNQPAAQYIIECVEAACKGPSFQDGLNVEQELFKKLLGSKEANALQHVFFSERGAAKIPGVKAKSRTINKVALIGAGLMAGGIAMNFVQKGIPVILLDREQKFLDHGLAVIKGNYDRSVKRGSKSKAYADKCMSLFSTTTKYEDLADVDMVIEAVFEDMKLKKEIFKKLDAVCKPGCILASNTSFLSIDEMASVTKRPEDVIGMHFFSPANVMPLLENVRGSKSSDETIATVMATGTKIGKWPVLAGNCFGFIANRAMSMYGTEARVILNQGSSITDIDRVAQVIGGMPMGPLSMTDLTGTAIGVEARKRNGLFDPEKILQDWLVDQNRMGMKNGKGYYDYDANRKKSPSNEVNVRLEQIRKNLGITPQSFSDTEIFERIFYPVMNECFKILEEGHAIRPADIDVVLVHGYNWPRVSGGPLHQADNIGLQKIVQALQKYQASNPESKYFKPSKLLMDCVNANQTLAKYWPKNSKKYGSSSNAKL